MKIIFVLILSASFFLLFPKSVLATSCDGIAPNASTATITDACSFPETNDGLDGGTITINTGGTLTVNSGYVVTAGSFVLNGGAIARSTDGTAILKLGTSVWMLDADADHYPANITHYVQTDSPGEGYVRKNTLTSISDLDCYDANANAKPGQTTYYTVNRGDSSFDYNCDSAITKRRLSCNTPTCSNLCVLSCPYIDASGEGTACGTPDINAGYSSSTRNNDEYGNCVSCTNSGTTLTTMECL